MDDLEDFLEGDILGTQISSRQIADFIKLESFAEADNFLRRLRAIDIFAVQRFVDREIESICDRNKSLFGSVVFAYLALTIPLGYLYLFEPGVDFGSFGGLLLFVIVSLVMIGGTRNVAKDWRYLTDLTLKDRICKQVINESLVISQSKLQ